MAENVQITAGSGTVISTDECTVNGVTVQVPRGKVGFGVDGSYVDVSASDPLPVNFTNTTLAVTGTFWQATQPVSGTVTANAGTNLNTSLLALESGGNLATIAGKDFATQSTLSALNTKVTACNTGAVVIASGNVSAAFAASELHIGEVGGNSALITPTLAVTASSAYAAGNVVGGILTLTGAMRKSGGTGVIQNVHIIDQDNQKPLLDIIIFSQNPSNGTYTDKTAITWNATDLASAIARVSITSADWTTIGSVAFTSLPSLGKVMAASGSANLYAVMVTSSTPTWTGTGKLTARFGFLRD